MNREAEVRRSRIRPEPVSSRLRGANADRSSAFFSAVRYRVPPPRRAYSQAGPG